MEDLKGKIKDKIEEREVYTKNAMDDVKYSYRTFDSLVIVVSGGGIYVVLESIKYSMEKDITSNQSLLIYSGVIFLTVILLNLISQLVAIIGNEKGIEQSKKEKQSYKKYLASIGRETQDESLPKYSKDDLIKINKIIFLSKLLKGFNWIALGLLVFGIGLLICFFVFFLQ
ncbi:MAG: hypothetical protein COC16_00145 [Lutibacter sp.]|nr:MAG: hypothetical protein COC16_00145 [Lutibacter sp.]